MSDTYDTRHMLETFTSTEGADVYVLTAHTALPLLLEGLFLEDVGLSLTPLHINTNTHRRKPHSVKNPTQDQKWQPDLQSCHTLRNNARILV